MNRAFQMPYVSRMFAQTLLALAGTGLAGCVTPGRHVEDGWDWDPDLFSIEHRVVSIAFIDRDSPAVLVALGDGRVFLGENTDGWTWRPLADLGQPILRAVWPEADPTRPYVLTMERQVLALRLDPASPHAEIGRRSVADEITAIAANTGSGRLFLGGMDGHWRIVDLAGNTLRSGGADLKSPVIAAAMTDEFQAVVAGYWDGTLALIADSHEHREQLSDSVFQVACSRDGRFAASIAWPGAAEWPAATLSIWNVKTGEFMWKGLDDVCAVDASDGLWWTSEEGHVLVALDERGKPVKRLPVAFDDSAFVVSADARHDLVAAGTARGRVYLWSIGTQTLLTSEDLVNKGQPKNATSRPSRRAGPRD